ncbi:MAG: hypothetical protein DHS20C15_20510 [Planctomycetota bacterium]|nr:MAG: hypothetical protein DHS20C15_20510 [Planctomycetota bacterium]
MLLRIVAIVTLLLTSACRSTAPQLVLHAEHGVIRADIAESGERVVRLLDDLAPRVRDLLPGLRPRRVEVWVQSELEVFSGWPLDPAVPAFTLENGGRIHLLEASDEQLSFALSHELVHALLSEEWSTLPSVAEEGLADWVQEHLHPNHAAMLRADHLAKASSAFGGLRFGLFASWATWGGRRLASFTLPGRDASDESSVNPNDAFTLGDTSVRTSLFQPYRVSVADSRLYGIGYLVVSRIVDRNGVRELQRMCRRASEEGREQVPAQWLLAAAGLEGSETQWREAISARIGPDELAVFATELAPFLAELLVRSLDPFRHAAPGHMQLFERVQPRLGLLGAPSSVRLSEVPAVLEALDEAWIKSGDDSTDSILPVSFENPAAPVSR